MPPLLAKFKLTLFFLFSGTNPTSCALGDPPQWHSHPRLHQHRRVLAGSKVFMGESVVKRTMESQPPMKGPLCCLPLDACAPNPPHPLALVRLTAAARPEHPVAEIRAERAAGETSRTVLTPSPVITDTMSTIRHQYPDLQGHAQPTETGGLRMLCSLRSWTTCWTRPNMGTVSRTMHLTRPTVPSPPRHLLKDAAHLIFRLRKTFASRKRACPKWLMKTYERGAVNACMVDDDDGTEGRS